MSGAGISKDPLQEQAVATRSCEVFTDHLLLQNFMNSREYMTLDGKNVPSASNEKIIIAGTMLYKHAQEIQSSGDGQPVVFANARLVRLNYSVGASQETIWREMHKNAIAVGIANRTIKFGDWGPETHQIGASISGSVFFLNTGIHPIPARSMVCWVPPPINSVRQNNEHFPYESIPFAQALERPDVIDPAFDQVMDKEMYDDFLEALFILPAIWLAQNPSFYNDKIPDLVSKYNTVDKVENATIFPSNIDPPTALKEVKDCAKLLARLARRTMEVARHYEQNPRSAKPHEKAYYDMLQNTQKAQLKMSCINVSHVMSFVHGVTTEEVQPLTLGMVNQTTAPRSLLHQIVEELSYSGK
jgi:hypothetical protein